MHKVLLLLLVCFSHTGNAQQSSPSLLSAGGGYAQTASYKIDWSLGEVMIETAATTGGYLTQGYLQPLFIAKVKRESSAASVLTVTAMPNPVHGQVTLTFSATTTEPLTLFFYNVMGSMIRQVTIPTGSLQSIVNTGLLAQGSYLVLVRNQNGKLYESFNLIKLH